jgi:signal recognition particle receptor subunit beta
LQVDAEGREVLSPGAEAATASGPPSGGPVNESVAMLATRMAALGGQPPALVARALRLAERAEAQRYHLAVLGDFKRGKSTLVNALIGRPVLPSGVVPVTTVSTEVHFGSASPGACVVFDDGATCEIDVADLWTHVSERGNPGNERHVRRVEVRVETRLGSSGVVLVDTPGAASVSERQSAAADGTLADSDGAIVVLSVDGPLSRSEEATLATLADRKARVFVVVNKCDHVSSTELAEVRDYLGPHLKRLLGATACPYFVSARVAGGDGDAGFAAFRKELERFLRDEFAVARERAGVEELSRLAATVAESVAIERAAALLDLETIDDRIRRFRAAAVEVREAFREDRLVLEADVARIAEAVGEAITSGAAEAARDQWPTVELAAQGRRGRALDRALDDAVNRAVTDAFDHLRRSVEALADDGWRRVASRFGARLEERVEALRGAASALFEVHLPRATLPAVADQRERFSYHFVRVESPGTSLARAFRTSLPTARAQRAMLERARHGLVSELDKHAGRARFDLVQRLDDAVRHLVAMMSAELDETEASIVASASRSQRALESGREEQEVREVERRTAMALAGEAARLAAGAAEIPSDDEHRAGVLLQQRPDGLADPPVGGVLPSVRTDHDEVEAVVPGMVGEGARGVVGDYDTGLERASLDEGSEPL